MSTYQYLIAASSVAVADLALLYPANGTTEQRRRPQERREEQ
jgi:hypothetical protein